jgi:hypothetical protein
VKLFGPGNQSASPSSSERPVRGSQKASRTAQRGLGSSRAVSAWSVAPAAGPDSRITATPARPAPEASATMVSGFM